MELLKSGKGQRKPDRPLAWHAIADLFGCEPSLLKRREDGERLVREAAEQAGLQPVSVISHQFEPEGYTAVVLLTESHLSLHTWPECGSALIDVCSCGELTAVERAIDVLLAALVPVRCERKLLSRG